jgi:hypothetical protein
LVQVIIRMVGGAQNATRKPCGKLVHR